MLHLLVILSLSASVLLAEQPPLRSVKNWEVGRAPGRNTWVASTEHLDMNDRGIGTVDIVKLQNARTVFVPHQGANLNTIKW